MDESDRGPKGEQGIEGPKGEQGPRGEGVSHRRVLAMIVVPLAIVIFVFSAITTEHNRTQVDAVNDLALKTCRSFAVVRDNQKFVLRSLLHDYTHEVGRHDANQIAETKARLTTLEKASAPCALRRP